MSAEQGKKRILTSIVSDKDISLIMASKDANGQQFTSELTVLIEDFSSKVYQNGLRHLFARVWKRDQIVRCAHFAATQLYCWIQQGRIYTKLERPTQGITFVAGISGTYSTKLTLAKIHASLPIAKAMVEDVTDNWKLPAANNNFATTDKYFRVQ